MISSKLLHKVFFACCRLNTTFRRINRRTSVNYLIKNGLPGWIRVYKYLFCFSFVLHIDILYLKYIILNWCLSGTFQQKRKLQVKNQLLNFKDLSTILSHDKKIFIWNF